MRFQSPRGTEDVLPDQSYRWIRLEQTFRDLTRRYGFSEIRTPTFEETELFTRSVGDTSDIVTKEMYVFTDKGDRSMTLKPEGTAGVMRAAVQHNLCPPGTVARLAYIVPVFRYERPQKGRYRESHQVGLELMGAASYHADAEVIEITVEFFRAIGLSEVQVSLNSIGRGKCRSAYRAAILKHVGPLLEELTPEMKARAEKNPLRLLDSKDPSIQEAMTVVPPITDFLEPQSAANFASLQDTLERRGIPFRLDPKIVRGLDYYTDTVFEIISTRLGAQNALCGGGRYDGLMKELGGPDTPSVGVGIGIERALIALEDAGVDWPPPRPDVFVIGVDDATWPEADQIAREVRQAGFAAITDPEVKSLKSQLRQADRLSARKAFILGPDELSKGIVQVRDLEASETKEVPRAEVLSVLRGS
jgi:histidyl-tRNA synthetase